MRENQPQLGRDPFGADDVDLIGHRFDRLPGGRVDLEVQRRGKPHRAQQAQLVLAEPGHWLADRPHDASSQILLTLDVVDHGGLLGIEEQAVDREIAPLGVVAGRAERHRVGMSAVGILGVGSKRGHFDLAGALRPQHGHHAEGRAERKCPPPAEQLADLVRPGAGGHVVILGIAPEQLIAHAAAGPIGLEAGGAELRHHLDGKLAL